MDRTQPDRDPARGRKCAADFLQGQVGLPGNQLQHPRSVLAQPGATVAADRARARMPSARQRCAQRMALLTLTSNRIAAARALPPSAIKPITRCLKSCEYGAGTIASNSMVQPQPRQSAPV